MLVPVVVDVPGFVSDHEIVAALLDGILENHEIMDQHLIHAAKGVEAVQLVLARLELNVPCLAREPYAERMQALAICLEQTGDRILR